MKENIHPNYKQCIVSCACGNTFETRSTQDKIHVEICSECHPFYTGKQKLIDTAGRVEQYRRKYERARQEQVQIKEQAVRQPVAAAKGK